MAQQPAWRGHQAPVEDADGTPRVAAARRSRLPLVVGVVLALAVVAGCAALTGRLIHRDPATLPPIVVGTCLSSHDLETGSSSLRELAAVPCARAHDAEVFALRTLRAGESLDAVSERCLSAAEELGVGPAELTSRGLEVRPLALTDATPAAGDSVACFVSHTSGSPLRGAVFTTGSDQ